MNRIFDITAKDITQIMRDRMTFLFLLIMPVAFTLLFSLAFGGSGSSSPSDPRLPVGYLDLDRDALSTELKGFLTASEVIRLDESAGTTLAELEKLTGEHKLAAAIVIPAGYNTAARAGNPAQLTVVVDPSNSAGQMAQAEAQVAANRLMSALEIAKIAQQAGGSFETALASALTAWKNPPVGLNSHSSASAELQTEEKQNAGGMSAAHTAPGMMLQFGIAGLLTAAQMLVAERKSRCMQRLLTTSVARYEILTGHFLAIFSVIFGQFIILIAFGQIALGLDYLRQPLATLIMTLCSALFIAGLGLLIGALAKTDEQAILFAMVPMFVFAGLGGAWVPLEVTGETFRAIGHLTPVAWAMDGFTNILVRKLDLSSIWLPATALLGYAALFCGAAICKFSKE
jgi:ABC-2 type transport system permease protein